MDLTMPVLDGTDATEILRRHMYHGTPIVALSASAGEGGTEPGASDAEGSTLGVPPQTGHLQSMVGLVWRSVVLWMLLLALLTLANIVG